MTHFKFPRRAILGFASICIAVLLSLPKTTNCINAETIGRTESSSNSFNRDSAFAPVLSVDRANIDFGPVLIGDSAVQLAVISNTGADRLIIASIQLTSGEDAGFSISQPPTLALDPNEKIALRINFRPSFISGATLIGSISITSDGGNATIALRGRGIEDIPPTVSIIFPSGGEVFTAGDSIELKLNISDNDIVTAVVFEIAVDGMNFVAIGIADGNFDRFILNFPRELDAPMVRIRVTARDRSGNTASAVSGVFTVKPGPQSEQGTTITFTFDPPLPGECAPQIIRVTIDNVCPNTIASANAGGENNPPSEMLDPSADSSDPDDVLGYKVYRVFFSPVGQPIPTSEEIVSNPSNLVGSFSSDATSFTDRVSSSFFGFGFYYAFTCFFGNGQSSAGSKPISVVLPFVNNPIFKKGSLFFDAAGSFIQPGAILIIDDIETFPLALNSSGNFFIVPKGARSAPGGFTLKQLVKKGRAVKLAIKNPDGISSCPATFTRRK